MNRINRAFGRLLRAKRGEMRLSQAAFARKVGWPQTTVSRVEQGARGVTLEELLAVAGACGLAASDLLAEIQTYRAPSAREHAPGAVREPSPSGQPGFSPGFSAAYAGEGAMLSQLARYGVRFLGAELQPAFTTLPPEEALLAALRYATDPRIFEALPALALNNAGRMDWNKLVSGAYALQLQNRLGMVVAAALQMKAFAKSADEAAWAALDAAHAALAGGKLDREEVLGPRPKTREALAFLRGRTPAWLAFWHGLGSADLQSFRRYLQV